MESITKGTDREGIRRRKEQVIQYAARRSLIGYCLAMDRQFVPDPIHHAIAGMLERCHRKEIKRLIINVHPRLGKSRLTAIEFPTWSLGHKPDQTFLVTGYSGSLVAEHSLEARNRMFHPVYRMAFPDIELVQAKNNNWVLNKKGRYVAAGLEGTIVGRGADVLIIDDPHAGFAEANSQAQRDKVWNIYTSDLLSRVASDGVIIVIASRLHPDDLTGRLMDPKRQEELSAEGVQPEKWEVMSLPALAEENDPIGREKGEPLSPRRWPKDVLQQRMAEVGEHQRAALYDQKPRSLGAGFINTNKFKIVKPEEVPEGMLWVRFWDLATSESKLSDYTAGPKCALDRQGNLWIRDMKRGQWRWPVAREVIKGTAQGEIEVKCGVEVVALGVGLEQNLREVMPSNVKLVGVGVTKDKVARAMPWSAMVDNGKVFVVRDGDWVSAFVTECSEFPGGSNDDQVDGVSGAYAMLMSHRTIFLG